MTRYDVSKHAAQGQQALQRKLKEKGAGALSGYMSGIGAPGRKKRWAKKKLTKKAI